MGGREHIMGADCWCEPILEHTTEEGAQVWLHVTDETGKPPPPEIVAEAIAQATSDEGET